MTPLAGGYRLTLAVLVTGNTRDGDDLPFSLVLSAPRDGWLDASVGHRLVLDDDPAPHADRHHRGQ